MQIDAAGVRTGVRECGCPNQAAHTLKAKSSQNEIAAQFNWKLTIPTKKMVGPYVVRYVGSGAVSSSASSDGGTKYSSKRTWFQTAASIVTGTLIRE